MKDPTANRLRRQYGVIARAEALSDGLSGEQVRHLLERGTWIRVTPNVFRHAAHPITPEQKIMASLLSAGPGSVASHQAAAYMWKLLDWREGGERSALTVPASRHPRGYGFDVHREDLDWRRVVCWRGIECTDPLWTLFDLGATLGGDLVDRAINRALACKLVTVPGLQAELDRRGARGRNGGGVLRARMKERGLIGAPAPSVLESRAAAFLKLYKIPVESCQLVTGPEGEYRVDFCLRWPVVWEVNGYVWHYTPEHARRDNERHNTLRLSGVDLYVSDWTVLHRGPRKLGLTLREALTRAEKRTEAPS